MFDDGSDRRLVVGIVALCAALALDGKRAATHALIMTISNY